MPKSRKDRSMPEISASSMADIAFLLLIFFLVVTTIESEEGVRFVLPPKKTEDQVVDMHDRNIFKVILNSSNKLLVEDEPMKLGTLKTEAKLFLTNYKANPEYSDSPQDAVISFRADRGTSYEFYIQVLHELKAAYQEVRAEEIGLPVDKFLALDKNDPAQAKFIARAQEVYPFRLSRAEPTDAGGN